MTAGRPYADVDALLGESDRAVQALGRDDLAEAGDAGAEELRTINRLRLRTLPQP